MRCYWQGVRLILALGQQRPERYKAGERQTMTDPVHVLEDCPTDTERAEIMAKLVELLIERRTICPTCLSALVEEFAQESRELWEAINQGHMH